MVFAEASNYVHIVDTRTFKEQILPSMEIHVYFCQLIISYRIIVGKGNPIAGLCFSPDGTKLYVGKSIRSTANLQYNE